MYVQHPIRIGAFSGRLLDTYITYVHHTPESLEGGSVP